MFKHRIFHELFNQFYHNGELPDKKEVIELMTRYNVCNPGDKGSMYKRRAGSVMAWLK